MFFFKLYRIIIKLFIPQLIPLKTIATFQPFYPLISKSKNIVKIGKTKEVKNIFFLQKLFLYLIFWPAQLEVSIDIKALKTKTEIKKCIKNFFKCEKLKKMQLCFSFLLELFVFRLYLRFWNCFALYILFLTQFFNGI